MIRVLESDGGDGPHQSGIHPCHCTHFRAHRQIQRDGWRARDGVSARGPGNHSATGPHLRGCAPIHRRTAAIEDAAWRTVASITTERTRRRSSSSWKTERRIHLEGTLQFRDVTVDPTTGSVILRVVFPNPKGRSPAGHVRPGGGEGRRQ